MIGSTFSCFHEMLTGPTIKNAQLEILNGKMPKRIALQCVCVCVCGMIIQCYNCTSDIKKLIH
jgi:hypothetical protein